MRARIAKQSSPTLVILGQLFHVLPHHENDGGSRASEYAGAFGSNAAGAQEAPASASGVIRHAEVPLLARYGTSCGLFDEWICDYSCVLVSDAYRLGEYVGDSMWVSGPLRGVIGGMPVMEVARLEMLKMKWMR